MAHPLYNELQLATAVSSMAMLEVLTDPDKYKAQLAELKAATAKLNEAVEELQLGQKANKAFAAAKGAVDKANAELEEAATTLKKAKEDHTNIRGEAEAYAKRIRNEASVFVEKAKVDSEALTEALAQSDKLNKSLETKETQLKSKIKQANELKKEYEAKLEELKSRFEGL